GLSRGDFLAVGTARERRGGTLRDGGWSRRAHHLLARELGRRHTSGVRAKEPARQICCVGLSKDYRIVFCDFAGRRWADLLQPVQLFGPGPAGGALLRSGLPAG